MQFLSEIKIFLTSILDWVVLMVIFTIFFFSMNVGEVTMFERTVPMLVPTEESFAAEIFGYMVTDFVPTGVPLIVTEPMGAFVAQIKIALLLAFVCTFPVLLFRILHFLSPALYTHERRAMYHVLLPGTLLFVGGLVFSYLYIVPTTFRVLYGYVAPIGAEPFLAVSNLVGLSLALMLVAGLAFTLPVVMVLLSALGLIPAVFWRAQWRYAVTAFLILSAIITPDGSGVSMVLLALPTSALYGAGALVSTHMERRRSGDHEPRYAADG